MLAFTSSQFEQCRVSVEGTEQGYCGPSGDFANSFGLCVSSINIGKQDSPYLCLAFVLGGPSTG